MVNNKLMGILAVSFALTTSSAWASPAKLHSALVSETQQELADQLAMDIRRSASVAITKSSGEAELAAQQVTDEKMHARMKPQMPEAAQLPWSECNS
ncbi:hypothetical protein ACFSJ3_17775 [Corallincola platygyrae]|uniref:Uncharacterized protein n=1 Tax=Corallincola platygyrae TaxID=1193278 RepID=A0ABW4XSM5_9GAMM